MEKQYVPTALFLGSILLSIVVLSKKNKTTKELQKVREQEKDEAPSQPEGALPSECRDCSLASSAPRVDRHIIICGSAGDLNWPKKIEKESETLASRLSDELARSAADAESPISIKLTACNEPNSQTDWVDIIIYPEQLRFSISRDIISSNAMVAFAKFISQAKLDQAPSLPNGILLISESLPWETLILVCTHASRDKRCGRAGPLVKKALEDELAERNIPDCKVAVRASSHIGGHRFAGTLIVYPQGQWYGYMTKKNVPNLLDHILSGSIFEKCFRGLGNISW